jgi:uncharacterized membrane protein
MRPKSLLAIAIGIGLFGVGIWRLTSGETTAGTVAVLAGIFLLFRGMTNTVRPGL